MSTCKQCGNRHSFMNKRNDGLCPTCASIKDNDEKQNAFFETKKKIDLIIKNITEESPPQSFTFINWGIKKGGTIKKVSGLVVGAAVGGAAGEMLFGGSLLSERPCSGEFGILIVTTKKIYIGHFVAPFESKAGSITPEHLELFQTQIDSKNITLKEFNTVQTQISKSDPTIYSSDRATVLVCGSETYSFHESELFIHGTKYDLPSLDDIHNDLDQLKTLITPKEFADKLYYEENPIPSAQLKDVENDVKYIESCFEAIARHKKRDALVPNFQYLATSLQSTLEEHIKSNGLLSRTFLLRLIFCISFFISFFVFGFVRDYFGDGPVEGFFLKAAVAIYCLLALLSMLISIGIFVLWRRSVWCRKIVNGWEQD